MYLLGLHNIYQLLLICKYMHGVKRMCKSIEGNLKLLLNSLYVKFLVGFFWNVIDYRLLVAMLKTKTSNVTALITSLK